MDVDELLKNEADRLKKSKNEESKDTKRGPAAGAVVDVPKKRAKKSGGGKFTMPANSLDHLSERERQVVLQALDDDDDDDEEDEERKKKDSFNATVLKRMLNTFEKKFTKNQEMRIKYADIPEKFMDSEIELNDTVQEMHVISTRPDLYPVLVAQSSSLNSLFSLLSHENIDICASAIGLIQELTDLESSTESVENVTNLIDLFCEQQIFQLLVVNLERMDEKNKDESEAVHNVLAIVENIIELKPNMSLLGSSSADDLLKWLLNRIKIRQFDNNKLYAVEILSILVQTSDDNRKLLGDYDGIDHLLQQIAYYKKNVPKSQDETEYMENLFDCLCSCLLLAVNREKFLEGEGLQLMRLILREQKTARTSALKVLSYAMNNLETSAAHCCQLFVETLGLSLLFPLFMMRQSKANAKNKEDYIVSIVASLLRNCEPVNKERCLAKFSENNFEKIDRLFELYYKYLDQVERVERSENEYEDLDEDDDEANFYLKKLDNGLFTLQSIVYIILDISANDPKIKQRVLKQLNLRNSPKSKLISIIKEYDANLGDGEEEKRTDTSSNSTSEKSNSLLLSASLLEEKERIKHLIDKF